MTKLCFSRETVRDKYVPLMDAPIAESDPRHDDHTIVMEASFRAEAHASDEARDAKLGAVSEYFEYVRASPEEVEAAQYPLGQVAIGPAINEPGFDAVAPVVMTAALDLWLDRTSGQIDMSVVIARTNYFMRYPDGLNSAPVVSWCPLYEQEATDQHVETETAIWLRGFTAGYFNAIVA